MDQASRVDPTLAAIADAIRLDTASSPHRRIILPTELIGIARRSAGTGSSMLPAALSGLPSAGPAPGDGALALAAVEVFGVVDLRAPTVERLRLRLAAIDEVVEPDRERSVWRTPAMLTAMGAAAVLIMVAIALVVVGGF
jgi:hypothetical protein